MALLRAPKMTAAAMTSLMLIDTAESSAWLARERFSFNCARIEAMLIDDHAGRDLPLVRVRLVPSNAETVRPGATALEPLTAKTERVAALGLLQQVGGPVRASAFRRYIALMLSRRRSAASELAIGACKPGVALLRVRQAFRQPTVWMKGPSELILEGTGMRETIWIDGQYDEEHQ